MKVGDYVRTNKGEIGKLKELKLDFSKGKRLVGYYTYREVKENYVMFDNTNITQRFVDGSCYYLTDDELKMVEESIIKSSPNIIDLIEVGDYVNGYKVKSFVFSKGKKIGVACACDFIGFDIDEIKSIITKEQFESMEFKVK